MYRTHAQIPLLIKFVHIIIFGTYKLFCFILQFYLKLKRAYNRRGQISDVCHSDMVFGVMNLFSWIQLFRERLSYKRGKAYATMSKVIMGNGGFYTYLSEPRGDSTWWKETAQTRIHSLSCLVAESPWTSIKQSQTLTSHNANRHCSVRF